MAQNFRNAEAQNFRNLQPGVYKISELYKSADVVGLVKIVSGNSEDYQHTVYKGGDPEFQRDASRSDCLFWPLRWRATGLGIRSVPS